MSGREPFIRTDPVQLQQAMEIGKLRQKLADQNEQLGAAMMAIEQTRGMLRMRDVILTRILAEKYPEESAEIPSLVLDADKVKGDIADSSIGCQMIDTEDGKVALYPILTRDQLDASRRRLLAKQAAAQAKAEAEEKAKASGLILP